MSLSNELLIVMRRRPRQTKIIDRPTAGSPRCPEHGFRPYFRRNSSCLCGACLVFLVATICPKVLNRLEGGWFWLGQPGIVDVTAREWWLACMGRLDPCGSSDVLPCAPLHCLTVRLHSNGQLVVSCIAYLRRRHSRVSSTLFRSTLPVMGGVG